MVAGGQDAVAGDQSSRYQGDVLYLKPACLARSQSGNDDSTLRMPQAFFAEAATNPAVFSRIPGGAGGNPMSAADAPFVDAAVEEQGLEL